MSTAHDLSDGEAFCRALLAILHASAARGVPVPSRTQLCRALGTTDGRVERYLRKLREEGRITLTPNGSKRRVYVSFPAADGGAP